LQHIVQTRERNCPETTIVEIVSSTPAGTCPDHTIPDNCNRALFGAPCVNYSRIMRKCDMPFIELGCQLLTGHEDNDANPSASNQIEMYFFHLSDSIA